MTPNKTKDPSWELSDTLPELEKPGQKEDWAYKIMHADTEADAQQMLSTLLSEAYEEGLNENWGGDRKLVIAEAQALKKLREKVEEKKRIVGFGISTETKNNINGYNQAIREILTLLDELK